jgi:D-serine deaminase-like pyridoxal phosphate-dependent protein
MLAAEPPDLLVAYPVVGARKLERLMTVAEQTKVTVSLDNLEAAGQLSDAAKRAGLEINVLAEADVGMGRIGVQPGEPLLNLARALERLPGLRLVGVMFYGGHIPTLDGDGDKVFEKLATVVGGIVEDFKRVGLPLEIVSGGSTPTLFHSHRIEGMNEIRPGTYIFNDRNTSACRMCEPGDCAVSILTTVVSTSRRNGMIIDGGSKTFSFDRLAGGLDSNYGRITEASEAQFVNMNEEHGYVDLGAATGRFKVGERVHVIPNHVCASVNLHEWVYGVRGQQVEEVWKVEGRGKLQ